MDTDRLIECIDPALWTAYNAQPDEWVILGMAADQAREAGRDDVATFIDWVIAKRRYPTNDYQSHSRPEDEYGWFGNSGEIPPNMNGDWTPLKRTDRPANALWRLWLWWSSLPSHKQALAQQWNPLL